VPLAQAKIGDEHSWNFCSPNDESEHAPNIPVFILLGLVGVGV